MYTKVIETLDFNTPNVGYEDKEKNAVCACCGTYYVVGQDEQAYLKETVTELYEACKLALEFFVEYDTQNKVISGLSLQLNEALAKARGE